MGEGKRRPKKFNRRHPPRVVVLFIPKPMLAQRLKREADAEGISVSKMVNDLLCEGFDIPENER